MSRQNQTQTVTVHVPIKFRSRGGRNTIISEIGPTSPPSAKTEDALLKALAKAYRWRSQIENGEYASITELAKARGVNDSYACRLLRLTLLSPQIVAEILDARQAPYLALKDITKPMPAVWADQIAVLSSPNMT
jgi:hypothetical protein